MKSIWWNNRQMPEFAQLKEDIETDVLIIGGGMAGILCAYFLTQAGADCILLESGTICSGVTCGTTAKITAQHGLIYDKLIKQFGREKAKMYLSANLAALEKYRNLASRIDCDFEEKDSFVYSLDDIAFLQSEVAALKSLGFNARFMWNTELPFHIAGAVKFKNQAQFSPLKFAAGIAKDLRIYENTRVIDLRGTEATTKFGRVRAKKIIVASHFPFLNKRGLYSLKMYQSRSYVLAADKAPDLKGMYIDASGNGLSLRNCKDLLFVGSGSHRTGKKSTGFNLAEEFLNRYYPNANVCFRWATQDCMTLDGVPYIGRYASSPDIFVATGFNKWGMTSSMVAANILCDFVMGRENENAAVFSPQRSILKPQLAINVFEAVTNLLSITPKRCPHLGCALKWNDMEHSWDCPCHGSRFAENGKLLDGPATGDLKQQ